MKKNSLIKLFLTAVLAGTMLCTGLFAVTITSLQPAAQTNSIATGPGQITQISCTATAGVAYVVSLYDAPALTLTNYTAQYTNYVPTVYTNIVTYTDILGNTVSNSYYFITNLASIVGSSGKVTNTYRLIGTFAAPANTTVTIPYDTANPFIFGLMASNNVGGSLTINYQPLK